MEIREASGSRETLRGRPLEVRVEEDLRSMRGSFADADSDVEDIKWHRRKESTYERQKAASIQRKEDLAASSPTTSSDTYIDPERAREGVRTRDVSLSSSPSLASGGKRKSWGSPRRLLERVKTRTWASTSPRKEE